MMVPVHHPTLGVQTVTVVSMVTWPSGKVLPDWISWRASPMSSSMSSTSAQPTIARDTNNAHTCFVIDLPLVLVGARDARRTQTRCGRFARLRLNRAYSCGDGEPARAPAHRERTRHPATISP